MQHILTEYAKLIILLKVIKKYIDFLSIKTLLHSVFYVYNFCILIIFYKMVCGNYLLETECHTIIITI